MARLPNTSIRDLLDAAERFAEAYPGLAGFLGRGARDPTSERVREGLFWLPATVLDWIDQLDENNGFRDVAESVAPVRPLPSAIVVQCETQKGLVRIHRGAEVTFEDVRFRFLGDVAVGAVDIQGARIAPAVDGRDALHFNLVSTSDLPLCAVVPDRVRIFVDGPREAALLALHHLLSESTGGTVVVPGEEAPKPLGSGIAWGTQATALAPDPEGLSTGADWIRDYFARYERFCFVEFDFGHAFEGTTARVAAVTVPFRERWPHRAPLGVDGVELRLHCVPAVNLFPVTSEETIIGPETESFPVRVAGYSRDRAGVYAVVGVTAQRKRERARNGSPPEMIRVPARRRFSAETYSQAFPYAFSTLLSSRGDEEPEALVTLTRPSGAAPMRERHVVWCNLLATNLDHARVLRPRDDLENGAGVPDVVRVRTLLGASPYVPAPTGDELDLRTAVRVRVPSEVEHFNLQSLLFSQIPRHSSDARIQADLARVDAVTDFHVDTATEGGRRGYIARLRVDDRAFAGLGDVALLVRIIHAATDTQSSPGNGYLRCEASCVRDSVQVSWPPAGARPTDPATVTLNTAPTSVRGEQLALSSSAQTSSDRAAFLKSAIQGASRFGFLHAMRYLEHALAIDVDAESSGREGILCEHLPDLTFPASDVAWIRAEREGDSFRVRLALTFLGLLGVASPLSTQWSEQVLRFDADRRLRDFFDAFHHRTAIAMYSAWKRRVVGGSFGLDGFDEPSRRLRALVGIDAWAPRDGTPLPPMMALGLGDQFRGHPHTVDLESAERLLRYLRPAWDIRLEPNVPRFLMFSEAELARVGSARLGPALVCGDGQGDQQGLVRVHVGPVDGETYRALMPGGAEFERLARLVERVLLGAVDLELVVAVASRDVRHAAVGGETRLGVDARYSDDEDGVLYVLVPLRPDVGIVQRQFLRREQLARVQTPT